MICTIGAAKAMIPNNGKVHMKELRVAIFVRGSDPKQTNKGKLKKAAQRKKQSAREIKAEDDLPLQKELIRQFVESQPESGIGIRWVLTGLEYIEAGVSGFHTHVSKRKALNRAFDDAKADLFDILVIYKLDRFGRRSVESLNHAIKFLSHCRIWVVDKKREFSNSGDVDEFMNFVEFWAAKRASIDTQTRVTDAMKEIHKEGYWTGGNPPYGYINHPEFANMLQVVEAEAEVVKDIYKMYTENGHGMLKIAGILNEQGKRTKTGLFWNTGSIRKILRNTVYKGYLSYGKTETAAGEFGSYQKYLKEGEETVSDKYWKEYDLIGADTWDKAQAIKKSRVNTDNLFGNKMPSKGRTGQGLLVGILKCECGSNMTRGSSSDWINSRRTEKGPPYGTYRCLKRIKSGVEACGAEKGLYRSAELEAVVITHVKAYMQEMVTADVVKEIKKKAAENNDSLAKKIKLTKQEIDDCTEEKNAANAELMKILTNKSSRFSEAQVSELYENAVKKLDKATRNYAKLKAKEKPKSRDESDIKKLQALISDWDNIFDNAATEIKRRMIASVVSEIKLKGKDIDIVVAFDFVRCIGSIAAT
jgi:DNA invertase Pin-like site-specific DNA recombinase